MLNISHPSFFLHPNWIDLINDTSLLAENKGRLHPNVLELAYRQGWFRLFVPAEYGGLEKSLPEVIRLEEALSWADASLGWVITLCSGAGWFGGFLDPALAKGLFKDKQVCLAGSGAATGSAEITDKGFKINGKWRYASGAFHATVFTANCLITDHGKSCLNKKGEPEIRAFIFKKEEVNLLPEWNCMGLQATGSHSFEVKDLKIPQNRCFRIDPEFLVIKKPVYQYPFLQLAETTLAVNLSGMAIRFMDLSEKILTQKIQSKKLTNKQQLIVEQIQAESQYNFDKTRSAFYTALNDSWKVCEQEEPIPEAVLNKVSETSRTLAKIARQTVDELYPYCGLIAAGKETNINRVWRDIHTASQHALLTFL